MIPRHRQSDAQRMGKVWLSAFPLNPVMNHIGMREHRVQEALIKRNAVPEKVGFNAQIHVLKPRLAVIHRGMLINVNIDGRNPLFPEWCCAARDPLHFKEKAEPFPGGG